MKGTTTMTSTELTCSKCGKGFSTLAEALRHCQKAHGITRQQAQNEIKIHRRR